MSALGMQATVRQGLFWETDADPPTAVSGHMRSNIALIGWFFFSLGFSKQIEQLSASFSSWLV